MSHQGKPSSASISLKQAFGILIALFVALLLLSTLITCFAMVIQHVQGSEKMAGWPALVGMAIFIILMLLIIAGLSIVGWKLLKDKNGFDWKQLRP